MLELKRCNTCSGDYQEADLSGKQTCRPQPRCQLSSSCALAVSATTFSRGSGTPFASHLRGHTCKCPAASDACGSAERKG